MKRSVLQIAALVPIPVIVALVLWAGDRPQESLAIAPHADKAAPKPSPRQQGLALPDRLPGGWALQGEVERFDKESLFDRINGAAPAYIQAGFVASLGAEYAGPAAEDPVVVDAYDMGTPSRALGMYSAERDSSYTFLEVGAEGYMASGTLNFWHGQYYVKLAGFGEGEAFDKALIELARGIAAALPPPGQGHNDGLATLALLPKDGQADHTLGYSHAPLGGIEGLSHAYFATYGEGDGRHRLFLIQAKDPAAAGARLDRAQAALTERGAKVNRQTAPPLQQVTAAGETGVIVLLQKGAFLGGALEASSEAAAATAKQRLTSVLTEATGP